MKTAKFFSLLSLAMIFAGANTVFSSNVLANNPLKSTRPVIRYEVTVHLAQVFNTCSSSLYLIQLTDETGRLVAPAKIFVPGNSKYVFNESVSQMGKLRIANMVLPSNIDPYTCPNALITQPDVEIGPFIPGQTYSFDLYPIIQKGDIRVD